MTKPTIRRAVSPLVRQDLAQQLIDKGIKDERVIKAIASIPREDFVEESLVNLVYQDQPLPIGYEQTISQPYVVAYMTQTALTEEGIENVLEVGTGSGYQTAVLASIIPRVFTIERIAPLQKQARQLLQSLNYHNINYRCSDGHRGWKEFSPYDAILVTAAATEIPEPLCQQLAVGGRMVIPVKQDDQQHLFLVVRNETGFTQHDLGVVKFVPLIKEVR